MNLKCHGWLKVDKVGQVPILGDSHQSINRDLFKSL